VGESLEQAVEASDKLMIGKINPLENFFALM
jgi:hypothetical protein